MRRCGTASVLVDRLPPAREEPQRAERLGVNILTNYVEAEKITYVTDLVIAGARPEHLEQQPLPVLIVGVRGDAGEPFGMGVMRSLNPYYSFAQLLASPIGEQLTTELVGFMHLGPDELKTLTASEVRQLGWPLSRWHALFGVGTNFFTDLGLKPRELCMTTEEALATAALPNEDGEPVFKIDL